MTKDIVNTFDNDVGNPSRLRLCALLNVQPATFSVVPTWVWTGARGHWRPWCVCSGLSCHGALSSRMQGVCCTRPCLPKRCMRCHHATTDLRRNCLCHTDRPKDISTNRQPWPRHPANPPVSLRRWPCGCTAGGHGGSPPALHRKPCARSTTVQWRACDLGGSFQASFP